MISRIFILIILTATFFIEKSSAAGTQPTQSQPTKVNVVASQTPPSQPTAAQEPESTQALITEPLPPAQPSAVPKSQPMTTSLSTPAEGSALQVTSKQLTPAGTINSATMQASTTVSALTPPAPSTTTLVGIFPTTGVLTSAVTPTVTTETTATEKGAASKAAVTTEPSTVKIAAAKKETQKVAKGPKTFETKPVVQPAVKASKAPTTTVKQAATAVVSAQKPAEKPQPAVKPAEKKKEEKPLVVKVPEIAPLKVARVPTIEEKNIQADRAYVRSIVSDRYSKVSPNLKTVLTPAAINFIVKEAQMPFKKVLDARELDKKIHQVTVKFLKKFDPENKKNINKRELYVVLRNIIKPEHVFQIAPQSQYLPDKIYNQFLETLDEYITPVNTTLQEWALRFLTSESILVALPVIKALEVDGKSFNQLTPIEKKRALQPVIAIVTERFLRNFSPVQKKFQIQVPGRIDEAIKYKVSKFLSEKFISSLD